jgi:hypothetical protein
MAAESEVEGTATAATVRSLLDSSSEDDEPENEIDADIIAYLRKFAAPDARNDTLAERVLAMFSKRTRLAAYAAAKAAVAPQYAAPKTPQPLTVIKKMHIQVETEDAYELVEHDVEVPVTPFAHDTPRPAKQGTVGLKRWQKAKLGVLKGVPQAREEEGFYFKRHMTGRAFVLLLDNSDPNVAPEIDRYGWAEYLRRCRCAGIVPCSTIFDQLRTGMLLLRSNSLGNAGLCALLPVLEQCRFALLDLRDNNLKDDQALRELSWQVIGGSAPSDLAHNLRQLSLSNNPLGVMGCAVVADMVQQLQSLEYGRSCSASLSGTGLAPITSAPGLRSLASAAV